MITHELVFTAEAFADLARRLAATGDPVRSACGLSRLADRWEWLVGRLRPDPHPGPAIFAVRATHPELLADAVRRAADRADANGVVLGLGVGPAAGHLAGLVRLHADDLPLAAVRVIAPGLPRFDLAGGPPPAVRDPDRFSRTVGALGEPAFARLQSLRVAVVGCGRTGSLAADHAAAYGLAGLTLIDPDTIEPHNLGEMAGLPADAVGQLKAEAVADRLRQLGPTADVRAVPAVVQSLDALFALKAADLIVCCPDNPAARLTTAGMAARYLKPVLDLGTGVVRPVDVRRVGLDVRWLLPGRCAGCVGGADDRAADPRQGSLRSVNTAAVGLGFVAVEQFLGGVASGSVWLQGELSAVGRAAVMPIEVDGRRACATCLLLGWGDVTEPVAAVSGSW